jgi:hypothetical protein
MRVPPLLELKQIQCSGRRASVHKTKRPNAYGWRETSTLVVAVTAIDRLFLDAIQNNTEQIPLLQL